MKTPSLRARLTIQYATLFFLSCALFVFIASQLMVKTLNAGFVAGISYNMPICEQLDFEFPLSADPQQFQPSSSNEPCMEVSRNDPPTFVWRSTSISVLDLTTHNAMIVEDMTRWSAVALVALTFISGAVGWFLAGRMLKPVHVIAETARRLPGPNLDERIALVGPHDELKDLADTFDTMLDRIETAFRNERRLVATMSHELRTPLANQRTVLDVALLDPEASASELRGAMLTAIDQNERSERIIEGLLILATASSRIDRDLVEVGLTEVVADAVADADAQASKYQISLNTTVETAVPSLEGNRVLLERLVVNLLGNAIQYNEPGGWVLVTVHDGEGAVELVVENSGALIATEDTESLTLPFRRIGADRIKSASGVGLGLSIVDAIASFHHGELTLEARAEGGLTATVRFPSTES